jgi:glycosyltransferase involved in cell wall biosynthesis
MKRLSIIIPCYNESKNLPLLISRCKEVANKDSNIEIIIVDNGSNDDTSLVLDELTSSLTFISRVKVRLEVSSSKTNEVSSFDPLSTMILH